MSAGHFIFTVRLYAYGRNEIGPGAGIVEFWSVAAAIFEAR